MLSNNQRYDIDYNSFENANAINGQQEYLKNSKAKFITKIIVVIFISVFSFVLLTNQYQSNEQTYKTKTNHKKDENYQIDITIYNPSYNSEIDSLKYLTWDAVAEPYKPNTAEIKSFTLNNKNVDLNSGKYIFKWVINSHTYYGQSVDFQIDDVGIQSAQVSIISDNSKYTKSFQIAVKYVRREMRTLTDDDRNEVLTALHKIYEYSSTEGRALYGQKFKSAEDFLYKHLNGAARSDCDHWHDGPAIVNHHVALTLEVEQAIQAINPALSLPYWEYAKDAYLYKEWQDSEIFQDDWFGDNSPGTADHSLTTGLWGDIETPDGSPYVNHWSMSKTGSLNPFVNSYGRMRSPWNNNPSSKICRFNQTYGKAEVSVPGCDVMAGCYHSNSLKSMFNCLNGNTHGPLHIVVGGAWGQEQNEILNDKNYLFLNDLTLLLYFKLLWRQGFARCPTSDTCSSTGVCSCYIPDEYITHYGSKKILELSGLYDKLSNRLTLDTDEYYTNILRSIQTPYSVGDMFTSGASFDPMFWPVHGQIERVLGLKRIKVSKGEASLDETWGFTSSETNYLQGRCDWSHVTSVDDLTLPNCDFTESATCYGHGIDDTLDFSGFLGDSDTYTNREFHEFIHPLNDDLPYVYDTYDFDYCEEHGHTFA